MNKLSIVSPFLATLILAFSFALIVESASGLAGDYTEPPGDPRTGTHTAGEFDALLISDSPYIGLSEGDLYVESPFFEVEEVLKINNIEALNGNTITIKDDLEGPQFGTFYKVTGTCTFCSTIFWGPQAGMTTATIKCDANDQLINCLTNVTDSSKKIYGVDIYKSGSYWYCKGLANAAPTVEAICLSTDSTSQTSMN